jgi:hypothetical protein
MSMTNSVLKIWSDLFSCNRAVRHFLIEIFYQNTLTPRKAESCQSFFTCFASINCIVRLAEEIGSVFFLNLFWSDISWINMWSKNFNSKLCVHSHRKWQISWTQHLCKFQLYINCIQPKKWHKNICWAYYMYFAKNCQTHVRGSYFFQLKLNFDTCFASNTFVDMICFVENLKTCSACDKCFIWHHSFWKQVWLRAKYQKGFLHSV